MMNDIKEIYICSGSYHLFQSIYIAQHSENEKVLVYLSPIERDIPVEIFSDYFDKIIYKKRFIYRERFGRKEPIFAIRMLKNCIRAGRLFPFTRIGRECYDRKKKYRTYVFDDYVLEANRIIQAVKNKKDSIILVEEGLMTYSTNQYALSNKRNHLSDLVTGVKSVPLVSHNPAIDTIMCKHPEKLPEIKAAGRKVIKIGNMFQDHEWVSTMINLIDLKVPSLPDNCFVWLGQPLVEVGLDEEDEVKRIDGILNLFDTECQFIVKPHPREKSDKYNKLEDEKNVQLLDMGDQFWVPAELIFQKLKPRIVLTAYSSAADFLVETNKDVYIIYCAMVMGIELDEDSIGALKGENRFYPQTMTELKEIIACIQCGRK